MSYKFRSYLYRVLSALAPILVVLGKVTESDVPLYLALASAVLGTGTAAYHTPRA